MEASQSLCKPSNGCKTNYSVWRFYLWYEKKIRRKRAIVRKRQTTRPGELVFMVSAKYCYAAHESRLHQNDRCKRFTLCLVLTVRFRSLAPWGKLFQLFI